MDSLELDFAEQIEGVINLLRYRLDSDPNRPILLTLYERYNRAKEIISSHDEKEKIMIKGGCMAYLDAFSDYDNPLLHEMNKA